MGSTFFPLPKGTYSPPATWSLDQGVDVMVKDPQHPPPLLAIGDGTIVRHGIRGFGPDAPVLKLDSTGGYVYYGHAGPGNAVPVGTHVKGGQVIGEVGRGQVGISSGPHLEIGFSDGMGTPLGRQTAGAVKGLLLGAHASGGIADTTVAGVNIDNPGKQAADAAAKALVGSLLGDVNWAYVGIVVALVAAGAYLLGHGVLKVSGSPKPDAAA